MKNLTMILKRFKLPCKVGKSVKAIHKRLQPSPKTGSIYHLLGLMVDGHICIIYLYILQKQILNGSAKFCIRKGLSWKNLQPVAMTGTF